MGGALKQVGRLGLAVVGSFVGGPIGFAIGTLAGGLLFPDKQRLPDRHGPRLGESQLTNSEYGVGIPKIWGTYRVVGNIIWASPVREVRRSTTQRYRSGKGGGGSTKQTTHEYFYHQSFALALCEGEAARVLRIYFDGALVYDAGSKSPAKAGLKFRFYPGDEEQLPDSIIESHEGVGNVSAHRGLCYLVFDELDITDYRRIPQIEVHVQMVGDDRVQWDSFGFPMWINYNAVNLLSRRILNWPASNSQAKETYSLDSLQRINQQQINFGESSTMGVLGPSPDGGFFVSDSSSGQSNIYLVDFATLQPKASIRLPYAPSLTRGHSTVFSFFDILGHEHLFLIAGYKSPMGFFQSVSPLVRDFYPGEGGLTFSWEESAGWRPYRFCHAYDDKCYIIAANNGGSPDTFAIFETEVLQDVGMLFGDPVVDITISTTLSATFTTLDIDPEGRIDGFWIPQGLAWAFKNIDGLIYDAADDSLIISFIGQRITVKISCADWSIKWRFFSNSDFVPNAATEWDGYSSDLADGHDISAGTWFVPMGDGPSDQGGYMIETATGRVLRKYPDYFDSTRAFVYDSRTRAVYATFSGPDVAFLDRPPEDAQVPVASILEDLREEVDAVPGDYADIADFKVDGYARTSPQASRAMIEPLASTFSFDAVDSGTHLKWVTRGKVSIAEVNRDDLVSRENDVIDFKRIQEVELPRLVSITYADIGRDFEQSTYDASRYYGNEIYNTQRSSNQVRIEAPMAIRADVVKRRADSLLREAWNSRDSAKFSAPRWMLEFDVGDVVTVLTPGRVPQDMRLDGLTVGSNLAIELDATTQDSSQYNSVVEAEEGAGFIPQDVLNAGDLLTRLYMLPVPLLMDSSDRARQEMVVQFAMGAYSDKWKAGFLEHDAGAGFEAAGASGGPATHGSVIGFVPVADPSTVFSTDEEMTIRVSLANGELDSVTQEEMLSGANAAAIIHNDERAEVIQFRTATLEEDGNYTLSGILRGRRGTDSWATTFDSPQGASFVMLDTSSAGMVTVPLSELGSHRLYRGSEVRQEDDMGDVRSMPFRGFDLMPYAPVHLSSEGEIGNGDVTLSWERRTRIRGDLAGGTGQVPLQEDAESYEVDIIVNNTVKRTLTGPTNAATYTAAQQIEDGVGANDLVEWVVYQMSAQVGRGFPSSRVKLQGLVFDVAQQSAVVLTGLGASDIEVAQQAVIALQTTESSLHVAQQSVILLHEEFELPPMDVAQQTDIVMLGMSTPEAMEIAQQTNIILHEV